jgi:hypothetical protein
VSEQQSTHMHVSVHTHAITSSEPVDQYSGISYELESTGHAVARIFSFHATCNEVWIAWLV